MPSSYVKCLQSYLFIPEIFSKMAHDLRYYFLIWLVEYMATLKPTNLDAENILADFSFICCQIKDKRSISV